MADSSNPIHTQLDTFDLLGVGFGPANIAIAAAISDKWSSNELKQNLRVIFIDKKTEFQWHPGMLIPGAKMQISCLKDLATLRNPCSYFTFLNYLHSQNRLSAFINRSTTVPSRREFADYLGWAAREVAKRGVDVVYGEEIVSISKIRVEERDLIEVTSRRSPSDEVVVRRTKDIILSTGPSPRLPRVLAVLQPPQWTTQSTLSVPVFHTSYYMISIGSLLDKLTQSGTPLKVAMVGSGQSCAECLIDLYNRLEGSSHGGHQIDMIIRKDSLKPSDDTPFVNEIFDPAATDEWYNLPTDRLRAQVLYEYKNTNYSVVNPKTIDNLYDLIYEQRLSDAIASRKGENVLKARVNLRINETVVGANLIAREKNASLPHRVTLIRQNARTHQLTEDTYDIVICGTGYERRTWIRLLRESNLAKDFGLASATDDTRVRLVPAHYDVQYGTGKPFGNVKEGAELVQEPDNDRHLNTESDTSSSSSTPPSSPSRSLPPRSLPQTIQLRISRAYKLLPAPSAQNTGNRVYLQGCEEATHGLSDTLLSVASVRSGEVLDDLLNAN
ncbi:hypothetical protein ACEPAH_4911 [Sanghuangporus vaninii]